MACVDPDPRSPAIFHQALAPYGTWVDDSAFGLVWVPSPQLVGPDFRPYATDGHWGRTADGEWVWVSDLPLIEATFHYGRWAPIGAGVWGWVAGACYADAWVSFRTAQLGAGYVGWTPAWPSWIWRDGRATLAPAMGAPGELAYVDCPVERAFDPSIAACAMSAQEEQMVSRASRPYRRATPGDATPRGPRIPLASASLVEVRTRRPPLAPVIVGPGASHPEEELAQVRHPEDGFPAWRPFPRGTFTLSTGGEPAYFGPPRPWVYAAPPGAYSPGYGGSAGAYGRWGWHAAPATYGSWGAWPAPQNPQVIENAYAAPGGIIYGDGAGAVGPVWSGGGGFRGARGGTAGRAGAPPR